MNGLQGLWLGATAWWGFHATRTVPVGPPWLRRELAPPAPAAASATAFPTPCPYPASTAAPLKSKPVQQGPPAAPCGNVDMRV